MKGSYSLIIDAPSEVEIGALGVKTFDYDYVVYNGSAFGPGGLKRVFRHFSADKKLHWHIDYLLEVSSLEAALIYPEKDLECKISQKMSRPVDGVGSSDCGCNSHLFGFENVGQIFTSILGIVPEVKVMDCKRYHQYKKGKDDETKKDVLRNLPSAKAYQERGNLR